MILKSNYIGDSYVSTKDLVTFYTPKLNSHLYFYSAVDLKRCAIVNSRGWYQVVCAGFLPSFFDYDMLPPVLKKGFYRKDFKPIGRFKDFKSALKLFRRVYLEIFRSSYSIDNDYLQIHELCLSSDVEKSSH